MLIAVISNGVMMFAYIIILLYCIGDVDKLANSSLPLIEVYYEATGSKAGTVVLILIGSAMVFFALFNAFASVSRLIWAFAKDNGLPFSKTFAQVRPPASFQWTPETACRREVAKSVFGHAVGTLLAPQDCDSMGFLLSPKKRPQAICGPTTWYPLMIVHC